MTNLQRRLLMHRRIKTGKGILAIIMGQSTKLIAVLCMTTIMFSHMANLPVTLSRFSDTSQSDSATVKTGYWHLDGPMVSVAVEPGTIEPGARGAWITAYVQFPGVDIDLYNIIPWTVTLNLQGYAVPARLPPAGGLVEKGHGDWYMLEFDLDEISELLMEGEPVKLTVAGTIIDHQHGEISFSGSGFVTIKRETPQATSGECLEPLAETEEGAVETEEVQIDPEVAELVETEEPAKAAETPVEVEEDPVEAKEEPTEAAEETTEKEPAEAGEEPIENDNTTKNEEV